MRETVPVSHQNGGSTAKEGSGATKDKKLCCFGNGVLCGSKPQRIRQHDASRTRYTRRCDMWSETSTSQQRQQRHPAVSEEDGCGVGAHVWRRDGLHRCSSAGDANENTQTVEWRDCLRTGRRSGLALCLHQVSRTQGTCKVRVCTEQYRVSALKGEGKYGTRWKVQPNVQGDATAMSVRYRTIASLIVYC